MSRPSKYCLSGLVSKRPDVSTLIPWHASITRWLSPTCPSLPVRQGSQQNTRLCHLPKFPHLVTCGFRDSWPYELNRHYIPIWAWPQIDEHLQKSHVKRCTFSAGLPGGPVIQFCGFQWHFSGPHRTGLVPLQPTLFLILHFNPRIYTTGVK